MLKEFKSHIQNQFPKLKEQKLLIAISGGLDSVVLAYLCNKLDLNISFAHCNFSLRGIESDGDEAFVKQLAQELGCKLFKKTFSTEVFSRQQKLSIQLSARELRYTWFKELVEAHQFDYVLTAHHADDNLETILINLSRGTGISGLTGIPEINEPILRPLLPFKRTDIEAFAKENQITWREDSSNASTKYLRNKLRHDVIPLLKEINPNILENTNSTISHLKETQDIVTESVRAVLKRAIKNDSNGVVTYHTSEFFKVNNAKAYLTEVFKPYGFTAFNDIVNLLQAETGKFVSSKSHLLTKDKNTFVLTELNKTFIFMPIEVNSFSETIKLPFGQLQFKAVNKVIENTKTEVYVDKDLLKLPLEISLKQPDDLIYPTGMVGKKKLNKYLKDEKLSLLDREKVLLLRNEKEIVWVINHRLDNRFKVTPNTQNIIKICLT